MIYDRLMTAGHVLGTYDVRPQLSAVSDQTHLNSLLSRKMSVAEMMQLDFIQQLLDLWLEPANKNKT